MNRIYRLIWNGRLGTYAVASEVTKGRGKGSLSFRTVGSTRNGRWILKRLALSLRLALGIGIGGLTLAGSFTQAAPVLPTNGHYVAGSGGIVSSTNGITVNQSTSRGIINWQSFSIGPNGQVQFNNGSGATLNRVTGSQMSTLLGTLSATGSVYLINPEGVLIGPGANINTGGSFVASTLEVSNSAFMAGGSLTFSGNSNASVVNQGTIKSANGDIFLLARTVENDGSLTAPNGTVGLGAGQQILLQDSTSDQRIFIQAPGGNATNAGAIAAASAELKASGGNVYALAGNTQGEINVTGTATRNGEIWLVADNGTVNVDSNLSARNANGLGGNIDTSGETVNVTGGAINTYGGTWTVDPSDFTVASSGGNITGATLSTDLGSGNVTLLSSSGTAGGSGDIDVNDAVNWSANTILTLTASNNVNVNDSITATGATAGIAINPNTTNGGQTASGSGTFNLGANGVINLPNVSPTSTTAFVLNGTSYRVINSLGAQGSTTGTDLQGIEGNLSGNYVLGSSINASATSNWNGGAGFNPLGNKYTIEFTGNFDGLGHTISNLTINRPSTSNVGLFGYVGSAASTISNVGLVGGSVTGQFFVGGLVGTNYGTINNTYTTGAVSATGYGFEFGWVGGLVGANYGGTISNSHATGRVSGSNYVGGLLGGNNGEDYKPGAGLIINSYATGPVSGSNYVGGLIGAGYGTVKNSYATGAISATGYKVGGLMGANYGWIENSYATGSVSGGNGNSNRYGAHIGGLVGGNYGPISNSYATGSVSGVGVYVGGLVGSNYGLLQIRVGGDAGGTITNSYATGRVTGSGYVGGLVGGSDYGGTISNSFATGAVSGTGEFVGGLVGANGSTSISNSYATGSISGTGWKVGGLVGKNTGAIADSYAIGSVSGSSYVGALVGQNQGSITSSYWDKSINSIGIGDGSTSGATGLTSTQMQTASNFAGFNFTTTPGTSGDAWVLIDANGTLNNANGVVGAVLPMLASEYSTTITNVHELQLMAMAPSANYTLGANVNAQSTYLGGDVFGSAGFIPVGNGSTPFRGSLNGENFAINGLLINLSSASDIGLIGDNGGTINNLVLTNVNINGNNEVGSIAGLNAGTIAHSEGNGTVTGNVNVGGLVGYNGTTGAITGGTSTTAVTGTSNSVNVGGLVGANLGTVENQSTSSGSVTANANGTNIGGLVGANLGTVDHSTSSDNVTGVTQVGGLVGVSTDSITNSTSSGNVTGTTYVGGLAGANEGTVAQSIYSDGNVIGSTNVGGLIGYNEGAIQTQSSSAGTVTGNVNVGGLVGYNGTTGAITGGTSTTAVTGTSNSVNVGGLVGANLGTVENQSTSSGSVTANANGTNIGGLVGANLGTVDHSTSSDNVTGVTQVGGLVGVSTDSITNSTSSGNVTGTTYVGGLAGANEGTVAQSIYSDGNVIGSTNVGGLIGYNEGAIQTQSSSAGTVTGNVNVGGLVGYNGSDGTLNETSSTTAVTGTSNSDNIGGLVGANLGGITESSSSGTVTGTTQVGGLVGVSSDSVTYSTSSSNVTGTTYVGGLIGANEGTITQSFSTGTVAGSNSVGGLLGFNNSTVTNSFWDIQASGQTNSAAGTGLTTAQAQSESYLTNNLGFVFTGAHPIWSINGGYPYLTWQTP